MNTAQVLYKIIYNKQFNYILRNLNFAFNSVFKTKIKLPPSGIIKLRTDSGLINIATNQTSYVSQLIYWNGYKNFEYSKIFEVLAKDINSFLDIGANIGFYSLLAARVNSNITVHAFEPAKGPKYYLNKNIQINNFEKQIKSIDLALSSHKGTIDFYEVDNLKYKYLNFNLAGEGNAGTKKTSRNFIKNQVNTDSLDNYINSQNIRSVDLIKLDTEGTEIDILKSGIKSIIKFQPIIISETLFNTTERELEDYFKKLNYQSFYHTKEGLLKVETIKRIEDNGLRDCFFVPESKIDLIKKFMIKD